MNTKLIELEQRIDELSREVLKISRNSILVNLRFLDAALAKLKLMPIESDEISIGTDGEYFVYFPKSVLQQYKLEKETTVRNYLHVLLHCIFRHMYVGPAISREYWDLSCDIAIENVIEELQLQSATAKRGQEQKSVIQELQVNLKTLTAEKIYRYFLDNPLKKEEMQLLKEAFRGDNHKLWYMSAEEKTLLGIKRNYINFENIENESNHYLTAVDISENQWKDISERVLQDLETFSKSKGDLAGSLIQNLREINREKYNYTKFLKKFAVRGEVMKIDDDEFDYIFYTYGLKLYGKVPLIEPLEYKEVKRIREFVIAIDTSGSVAGEIVQKFVQKTYNILKSTESFFSKINIHIIQCDAEIQEDVKITSQDEFDEYLKNMKIHGLGGTDFRPVFRHVDQMIKNKEFSNLRGIIYFTDGYGDYPKKKPDYQTAFVFLEDDFFNPEVPTWAIKLVLRKDEI